jgi:hypothetical protein|eukprot:SAG25_NODE_984_length_4411_cov_2.250000_5_plen_89_part_00
MASASALHQHLPGGGVALVATAEEPDCRPVIFLDIDGVLNRTTHATHIRVDDDCVARLGQLVSQADCQIVLSTFWRHFHEYITYVLHR